MSRGWPEPAAPVGTVALRFRTDADCPAVANMSAAVRVGATLFLAGDENASIERLTRTGGEEWGNHLRLALADFLDFEEPDEEADLEGLAVDDGWLWVLGSHARTRPKLKKDEPQIDTLELANLKDTRPRCVLARLPLVERDGAWLPVREDCDRRAAMLKQNKHGNALAAMIQDDKLLSPFTRIPAKEGGVDMEGIAVCGDRVAFGMRGPVIGGNAVLIEARIRTTKKGNLKLAGDPVKRLLKMEGLGIRDLKRCGDHLLILAGPTTSLSGPCALYVWRGWANDPPQDAHTLRLHRPERLFDLPFGRGKDHPEGLALWDDHRLLVVNDSPTKARLADEGRTLSADLYALPGLD
ncbi:MAG TPA: DUF3616 domain-containing protein [Allosphingosinicella sp.]